MISKLPALYLFLMSFVLHHDIVRNSCQLLSFLWVIYSNSPCSGCCAPGVTASHRFCLLLMASVQLFLWYEGITEWAITIWMFLWLLVMPVTRWERFLSIRIFSGKFQQERREGNLDILELSGWGHKYTPIQRVRQLGNSRARQLKSPRSYS